MTRNDRIAAELREQTGKEETAAQQLRARIQSLESDINAIYLGYGVQYDVQPLGQRSPYPDHMPEADRKAISTLREELLDCLCDMMEYEDEPSKARQLLDAHERGEDIVLAKLAMDAP